MNLEQQLALCKRHRSLLCLPQFDHLIAWQLGERLVHRALQHTVALAIDIQVNHHCIFSYVMAGATAENLDWVRRKRNTVDLLAISSYEAGLMLQQRGVTLQERYGLPACDYAVFGGGFPLRVTNAGIVGSVTISGAPHLEDHNMVLAVLADVIGLPTEGIELLSPLAD